MLRLTLLHAINMATTVASMTLDTRPPGSPPSPASRRSFWDNPAAIEGLADPPTAARLDQIRKQPWRGGLEPLRELEWSRIPPADIEGKVPEDLKGLLLRNGPGRLRVLDSQYGHWFDGDGAVMAMQVDGGRGVVQVASKYVQTQRFLKQKTRSPYPGQEGATPDARPGFALAGAWTRRGNQRWWQNVLRLPTNPANTNMMEADGKVYALCEGGPPVEIDVDTMETIGDFELVGPAGKSKSAFSAHYSRCPETGDIYNHGMVFGPTPMINLMCFDSSMSLLRQETTELPYSTFVHDSVISQNHVIYFVCPWVVEKNTQLRFLAGLEAFGNLNQWRPELRSYINIHDRETLKLKYSIEIPAMSTYHLIDAWEDGTGFLEVRCLELQGKRDRLEACFSDMYSASKIPLCSMQEYVINMESGSLLEKSAAAPDALLGELPEMNAAWKDKHEYTWLLVQTDDADYLNGIQKVNLLTGEASEAVTFGPHTYAGTPVFAPKKNAEFEDEGYILSPVYVADEHRSNVVILDARSMKTLTTIKLRQHVPYHFHGAWAGEGLRESTR